MRVSSQMGTGSEDRAVIRELSFIHEVLIHNDKRLTVLEARVGVSIECTSDPQHGRARLAEQRI